jgi:hypothetical protein
MTWNGSCRRRAELVAAGATLEEANLPLVVRVKSNTTQIKRN